ncbi:MAG: iron chelate uptake ABC transporter family permease subunit, partial [Desulfurivibrionaceae bacterium]
MLNNLRLGVRLTLVTIVLAGLLAASFLLGMAIGPSGNGIAELLAAIFGSGDPQSVFSVIVWKIRLPRVILAAAVGSTLSDRKS